MSKWKFLGSSLHPSLEWSFYLPCQKDFGGTPYLWGYGALERLPQSPLPTNHHLQTWTNKPWSLKWYGLQTTIWQKLITSSSLILTFWSNACKRGKQTHNGRCFQPHSMNKCFNQKPSCSDQISWRKMWQKLHKQTSVNKKSMCNETVQRAWSEELTAARFIPGWESAHPSLSMCSYRSGSKALEGWHSMLSERLCKELCSSTCKESSIWGFQINLKSNRMSIHLPSLINPNSHQSKP